jgi:hypothetical protein
MHSFMHFLSVCGRTTPNPPSLLCVLSHFITPATEFRIVLYAVEHTTFQPTKCSLSFATFEEHLALKFKIFLSALGATPELN